MKPSPIPPKGNEADFRSVTEKRHRHVFIGFQAVRPNSDEEPFEKSVDVSTAAAEEQLNPVTK